jgi:hypothetical protein
MEKNNQSELMFMYKKYEELCKSYKDLALKVRKQDGVAHDMSHMTFEKEE